MSSKGNEASILFNKFRSLGLTVGAIGIEEHELKNELNFDEFGNCISDVKESLTRYFSDLFEQEETNKIFLGSKEIDINSLIQCIREHGLFKWRIELFKNEEPLHNVLRFCNGVFEYEWSIHNFTHARFRKTRNSDIVFEKSRVFDRNSKFSKLINKIYCIHGENFVNINEGQNNALLKLMQINDNN